MLKISALDHGCLSNPIKHFGFALCTPSHSPANTKKVTKCMAQTTSSRKDQCTSIRLVKASCFSSFSNDRPRTFTKLAPACVPVATNAGWRHFFRCFS